MYLASKRLPWVGKHASEQGCYDDPLIVNSGVATMVATT